MSSRSVVLRRSRGLGAARRDAVRPIRLSGTRVSTGQRLPGIEGLRALAALSILLVHTWVEAGPTGPVKFTPLVDHHLHDLGYGVTLFFTLSGFLLYRPFASAILQGSRQLNLLNYLKNRALRILPGYWAVLLFCALGIGGLFLHSGGGLVDGRLTNPSLLLRAALLVQNYDPRTMLTGIGPAWSLAVEVVFYLILPLLAWLAWRLGSARGRSGRVIVALAPPALLLLVGLAGKAIAAFVVPPDRITHGWGTDWHSVLEYSFVGQADLFSFGMTLAVLHYFWREGRLRLPRHSHLLIALGALGSYLVVAKASPFGSQLSYSPYNTVIAFACTLLLALVVLAKPERSWLVRLLEARPLMAIGIISYSVFLWHHPLIRVARHYHLTFDGRSGLLLNLGIILSVTLVFSFVTYRYIEAPALRLRGGKGGPSALPPVSQVEAAP